MSQSIPKKLEDLPPVEGMPQGCAWGLFRQEGHNVELGTLNYLTPEVKQAARSEIQSGETVQLDWGMENCEHPSFGRKGLEHTIIDLSSHGACAFDDQIHVNVQAGSQWDGFKHWAHQATQTFYNGLSQPEIKNKTCGRRNGVSNWVDAGGIVGRGVLIDWVAWLEATGKEVPHALSHHEISPADLDAVLAHQGTTLRPGDILLVRSGFVRWHNGASSDERKAAGEAARYTGVEASEEMKAWMWERKFAAVAGDAVAFEAWPPSLEPTGVRMHDWFLAMWGTPIGEMWNLEGLSAACAKHKRYSFFLTSAPLNIPGGVSSTPNAIAVF